jgi:hypothetical protein
MNHAQELAAASLYNLATVFAGHVRNDPNWGQPAISVNDSWPAIVTVDWGDVAVRFTSRDIGGFTMTASANGPVPEPATRVRIGVLEKYVRCFG